MKKFFAFLLAFLIVVGIYLLMKKQMNPSVEVPASVKSILGLEKPQQNIANENKPTILPQPKENNNPIQDDELLIKDNAPSTGNTEAVGQPTTNNGQPGVIPSQEAIQTTGNTAPIVAAPEDDGLTPLQRAIKARNAAQ